ncbi:MAG: zinc ribbon-containing protein [Pseudomonadota bacterium]|nr:zinc ribbon-containing protein [Pseudomonadota bacterium]
MKKSLPPDDLNKPMGEAYELLLEKALQKTHQTGAFVHDMIEEVRGEIIDLYKLGDDEVAKLEKYVRRDLIDAAHYLDKTGNLKDWLGFDVALIKDEFWKRFSEAADQTTVSLNQLKLQAAKAEYHSGELVGLGTMVCDQCGQTLHFHKPGHIPPCPKCNNMHFHRQNYE